MSPPPDKWGLMDPKTITYLADRGLAVIILIGVYMILQGIGTRWVDSQENFTQTVLKSQKMQDDRFLQYMDLRREQIELDKERIKLTQETLEALKQILVNQNQ